MEGFICAHPASSRGLSICRGRSVFDYETARRASRVDVGLDDRFFGQGADHPLARDEWAAGGKGDVFTLSGAIGIFRDEAEVIFRARREAGDRGVHGNWCGARPEFSRIWVFAIGKLPVRRGAAIFEEAFLDRLPRGVDGP